MWYVSYIEIWELMKTEYENYDRFLIEKSNKPFLLLVYPYAKQSSFFRPKRKLTFWGISEPNFRRPVASRE
jgi:hypothetical protein